MLKQVRAQFIGKTLKIKVILVEEEKRIENQ